MKEPRLFLTDYITIELCLVAHLTSAQNCTFPLSFRCPSIVPVVKISLLARKITGGIPNIAWIPRGHPFHHLVFCRSIGRVPYLYIFLFSFLCFVSIPFSILSSNIVLDDSVSPYSSNSGSKNR